MIHSLDITERIAEAEAMPFAERCAALKALWWATSKGSEAERAVHAAATRAIPDTEAMPIAALQALLWATRYVSDARRAVESALDAAESA